MTEQELAELVRSVADGSTHPDDAVRSLRRLPFADLGMARIDHHRALRQGLPETIYGPGKTPAQCAAIVAELLAPPESTTGSPPQPTPVVLSRASAEQVRACPPPHVLTSTGPDRSTAVWNPAAARREKVVVATAGTADQPVADECAATLAAYGVTASRLTDCGVAGLHRLLPHIDDLADADVLVVVAGMEGALASVAGGITSAPVVAVPTSVGYGSSFEGVTALLAMLSSCAAGVTVVGIDNGYGAACAVMRILGGRQ